MNIASLPLSDPAPAKGPLELDHAALQRVHQQMQDGAVTPAMSPWAADIVRLLNGALATELVCEATGSPQTYSGRSMADSHRHLMITPAEWEAFMEDFQQTLDKFAVPQPEQEELKAIVESTREAIVVSPFQEEEEAAA